MWTIGQKRYDLTIMLSRVTAIPRMKEFRKLDNDGSGEAGSFSGLGDIFVGQKTGYFAPIKIGDLFNCKQYGSTDPNGFFGENLR